jgi:hypothetical protein
MNASNRLNFCVVLLSLTVYTTNPLMAQPCYLSRIIQADGDSVSISYNADYHIRSIGKNSIVTTNSVGFIVEIAHDQASTASFSKATFKYDANNNLILHEQFDKVSTTPSFVMKYTYNSFNQLTDTQSALRVDQNYFYGYRVFIYSNTSTKNPSIIKNYSGDARGKIGNPDETITLTYDDKNTIGYINPLDDFNPFATHNVISAAVVEVGAKPKTEIFTYTYNAMGYPISKSEKEGARTFITTYTYDCK